MLKKTITYTDYNDEEQTVDAYFNLNKTELVALYLSEGSGLDGYIEKIIQTTDTKKIHALFTDIVAMSYGVREGNKFIKNETVLEDFKSTGAFDQLVYDLITQSDSAVEFVNGIVPANLKELVEKEAPKTRSTDKPKASSKTTDK